MTFSNTGVLSIDGGTGAVTNVARTNVDNQFSVGQNITGFLSVTGSIYSYDSGVDNTISLNPATDKITFRAETSENQLDLYAGGNYNNQVISFPQSNTTLAGLAVDQTFTATNTFNTLTNFAAGISAAGGVTFAGTLKGVTANFTGLVSSTVGFSGAGTNLTGNASGLTAGSASKVQVTEAVSLTSYSLALVGSTGATGIYTNTSAPKWSYLPNTGRLTTTSGGFQAPTVETDNVVSVAGTSPLYIKTPWNFPVAQPIVIGDVDGNNNNTLLRIDDLGGSCILEGIGETQIQTSAGLALYNQYSLKFYDIQDPTGYVAFKAPSIANNVTWTLPSSDGSSNQVLTTNGSGILSWTTPSGGGGSSVTSFNGLTGAVQGVSAASAGTGIALSGATGAVTITNTGVLSVNGATGAIIAVNSVEGMTGDVSIPAVDLYLISIGII